MKKPIRIVGLDAHKDSISVAEDGGGGEVRYLGTIGTTAAALTKLVTDPGWERLARLLTDPRFSSEIVVGETPQEEETAAPKRRAPKRAAKRT